MLIFAVIISYKQVQFQKKVDYGYDIENIMNIELQEIDWDLFKNSVTHLPGTGVVMRDFIKSKNIPDSIVISQLTIDPDYVNTLNISVVTGKDFQAYSKTNPGNLAMINESAVSLLGYREPGDAVGQNITIGLISIRI